MSELPRTPESEPGLALPPWSESESEEEAKRLAPLAHPFKFVHPLAGTQLVSIHIAEGTLWATPNGGAVRGQAGSAVKWTCDTQFTLTFTQLGGTSEPLGVIPAKLVCGKWEAEVRLPASGALPPYYEYTITSADGLTLDPIVIVDKR